MTSRSRSPCTPVLFLAFVDPIVPPHAREALDTLHASSTPIPSRSSQCARCRRASDTPRAQACKEERAKTKLV
eukprot:23088_5